MTSQPLAILVIDDSPSDAHLLEMALHQVPKLKYTFVQEKTLASGIERTKKDKFDVLMLDLTLPDSHGLETVIAAHKSCPNLPIVICTGIEDEEFGIEAVRNGAQDYVVKGEADGWTLLRTVRYAIERKRAEKLDER